jgi:cell division protein FtsA
MALFNTSKSQNYTVGIDIGTYTARIIVTKPKENDDVLVEIIAATQCESKGLRSGYITDADAVRETLFTLIKNLKDNNNTEVKKANISIGGISVVSQTVLSEVSITKGDRTLGQNDILRALENAKSKLDLTNREILHQYILSYKIDGKEVLGRPHGTVGSKLEIKVIFIVCLRQHLLDLIEVITDAGIEIENIVASPIAAGIVSLTDIQKQTGVMLANIGAETVSTIVYENNQPISLKVFSIGGADFTKDIALGLKVGIEEAEKIKISKTRETTPERKLNEIIEARLRDIFEILEKHLKKINRDALLPGGIIITGGGSHISQIESLAKTSLRLPCKASMPDKLIQTKPRIRDVSWIVAYGLCNYKNDDSYIDNNHIKQNTKNETLKSKFLHFIHELMP